MEQSVIFLSLQPTNPDCPVTVTVHDGGEMPMRWQWQIFRRVSGIDSSTDHGIFALCQVVQAEKTLLFINEVL
jgi:hypothetical protein